MEKSKKNILPPAAAETRFSRTPATGKNTFSFPNQTSVEKSNQPVGITPLPETENRFDTAREESAVSESDQKRKLRIEPIAPKATE